MTATHLFRGTLQGEILDADGKVVGRIVPVEPTDYYYEWDTGFGLRRSFSAAPYNGMPPNRSMPLLSAAPTDWSGVAVRVPERDTRYPVPRFWNECLDAIMGAK